MHPQRISRRSFIQRLGGGLTLVGMASACGPIGSSAGQGAENGGSRAATPAPAKRGGTFILGTITPTLSANPYPRSDATTPLYWGSFNTLIQLDANRKPIPELAESWSFSDDRLTLTFKLRQDVKFHSGRAFTAEDAKWAIEHVLDPKSAVTVAGELQGVQVTATDASRLELKLTGVLPDIFGLLMFVLMIDPQSDVDRAPGGTGPFKFDSLNPGNELRLVRHEGYWRPGRPYLDAVTIRTLPDPGALVVNLESGAISAAICPASELTRLKSNSQFATLVAPADGNYDYLVSAVDPPFDDKRVRQAMSLALNRKRFTETLLYGLSAPAYIMWPRGSPAWDPSLDTGEFNLDQARQLLSEAGYPNGFETKIQASSQQYAEFFQFNQVYQSDLAAIGVKAAIEDMEQQQWNVMFRGGKFPALVQHFYTYADSDPAMAFTALPFRPDGNVTRFKSDAYAQLIAGARQEPDWNKRLALYRQIAQLVKDEAFVLPVTNAVVPYAMRRHVQGFGVLPGASANSPVYEDISLA